MGGTSLPWEMRLPFEQATIHYELKGTQQGSEILYIKEHGTFRAKHHQSKTSLMGMTTSTETIEITDPEWITTYNLTDRSGEKISNPSKIYQDAYNKFSAREKSTIDTNSKELGGSLLGQVGGDFEEKKTTVLGYDCDITTVDGLSTICLLHGTDIPLRSEVSIMGIDHSINATAIDTSSPLPPHAFTPPSDITVVHNQEADAMMTQAIQQTLRTLKEPDGLEKLKNQSQHLLPFGGLPGQMGDDASAPEQENQQQLMREMEQAIEMFKQMMPSN
jgi:hypothetical protein